MNPLVITADDVGLHADMTAGALAAHDRGVVTAVSVAANGDDFVAAARLLRERRDLDVGAHLVLVGERPLSASAEIPSLVDPRDMLLPGFAAFCGRALRGGIRTRDLRLELGRQMERLVEAGLEIVHVNSHQHLHALPQVRRVVLELATRFAVRFVRVPSVDRPLRPARTLRTAGPDSGGLGSRALGLRGLSFLARGVRRAAQRDGLRTVGRTIGIRAAGHFDRTVLAEALASSAGSAGSEHPATTELVVHPGQHDAILERRYGWGYAWERETAELCAPDLRAWLAARGFAPARFSDLP